MAALVCGGRLVGRVDPNASSEDLARAVGKASAERKFVAKKLDELHSTKRFSFLIAGNEGGAERLAAHWAKTNSIPIRIYPRKDKRETTTERNMRMLRESKPELVVAFGGGQSTHALVSEAKALGLPVLQLALP